MAAPELFIGLTRKVTMWDKDRYVHATDILAMSRIS